MLRSVFTAGWFVTFFEVLKFIVFEALVLGSGFVDCDHFI